MPIWERKQNDFYIWHYTAGSNRVNQNKIGSLCTDVYSSVLTSVLSITCTKYDTAFPVQETARPFGLSSETLRIVPISTNKKNINKYLNLMAFKTVI